VEGQVMNKEEQVMIGFRDLYNKMTSLNSVKIKERIKDFKPYKSSEIHCIEYVGSNVDSNVTKLAESLYMTLGAISKLTKKLIKKGLIESYRKPDNQKEIYFRLTSQGKVIFKVHEELHQEFWERDKALFEQVPAEHYDIMLNFVAMYNKHLDAEIKKQGLDITNRNDFE
jgi:DNA-binding MarR family transcriptional regulator